MVKLGVYNGVTVVVHPPPTLEQRLEQWYGNLRLKNLRKKAADDLAKWFGDEMDKQMFEQLTGVREEKYGKY
jgi:hypothetical protein